MCKFHKDVADAVATNPLTGEVDPLRYSITLVALAKFWIDKYMPTMGYQDGYNPYEMASTASQAAFKASSLEKDLDKARAGQEERISFLREAVDHVIAEMQLTPNGLFLPKHPDQSPHFLNSVMLGIYEGDEKIEWNVKADVQNKKHKPLRDVIERMFEINGYADIIEASLKSSISNLFITAPDSDFNHGWMNIYDRLPVKLRTAFGSCSLHGGGGAVAHLVVCGAMNTAIGGLSTPLANSFMYAVAPVVAVGTTAAVEKYKFKSFNPFKYALPVMLSLAGAWGVSQVIPHDHSAEPRMQWFYGLSPEQRFNELERQNQRYLKLSQELKAEVEKEASRQDMTVSMFMASLDVCGGSLTPRILQYEKEMLQKQTSPSGLSAHL